MAEEITNSVTTPAVAPAEPTAAGAQTPAQEQDKTFSQAEVDRIITDRLTRERKKYPTDEELNGYRQWVKDHETIDDRLNKLVRERDGLAADVQRLTSEVENGRRSQLLLSRGASADDVEFHAYKIGKLVTDDLPFEQAAEQYIQEHPRFFDGSAAGNMLPTVSSGLPHGSAAKAYSREQIAAMTPAQINQNWADIAKSLDA